MYVYMQLQIQSQITSDKITIYSFGRASEASETLSGVYKFKLVRYMYIHIWVKRYVCHNSSACHTYIMWAELCQAIIYMCQLFQM